MDYTLIPMTVEPKTVNYQMLETCQVRKFCLPDMKDCAKQRGLHYISTAAPTSQLILTDDILEVAFRQILTTAMALFTVHTPSITHFN